MKHDLTNSELNKSLKVLTKWNSLIKIYLMLKDNINISLGYDSKNDRKTKGSEASYSFNATIFVLFGIINIYIYICCKVKMNMKSSLLLSVMLEKGTELSMLTPFPSTSTSNM